MWRFLRKRRALQAYRTTLFKQLRRTYGRKLYYSPTEVTMAARDLRVANDAFICYALGMFCEREAFVAYHAARGETCDYDAMRAEAFGHVANVAPSANDVYLFGGGFVPHAAEGVHHDAGGDCGGGDYGGGDYGGGDCGGGDGGGGGGD
jgi:hypothetical protein